MIALGVNSGTSMDGISLAMVRISKKLRLLAYKTYPFPTSFKLEDSSIPKLAYAHYKLGEIFARSAIRFIRETRIRPDVIGSHGQTIFHSPPHTMQIGEGAIIACKTGITTVCDFRWQDLAVGGQGAPLIAYLDYHLFGGRKPVATLNLGGIANVTVVSKRFSDTVAFDTGPGNCVIDSLTRSYTKGRLTYDRNGELASEGKVDLDFLRLLQSHPFYPLWFPKSADKSMFQPGIRRVSINHITTATLNTALSVAQWLGNFRIERVVVSGGGVFNKTLMSYLKCLVYPVRVISIENYGIHPQAKEPMLFALLAARTILGKTSNVPSATGACRPVVLGKIVRC